MGPANLKDSKAFWDRIAGTDAEGHRTGDVVKIGYARVRPGERLCALALVKRFGAGRRSFSMNWSLINANWHGPTRPPLRPSLGLFARKRMNANSKSASTRATFGNHTANGNADEDRSRADRVKSGLNARRHVGPALHAAISEALANFALHFVSKIVKQHQGELIYAGGDDVLALLPTSTALACAGQLYGTFRENWKDVDKDDKTRGPKCLLMGSRATLSAGIAVVHYQEDLRFALEQARAAEKAAKNSGRDALELRVLRRSGEHAAALCPWDFVPTVEALVQAFLQKDGKSGIPTEKESGASDRWAYHLRAELETLRALPPRDDVRRDREASQSRR